MKILRLITVVLGGFALAISLLIGSTTQAKVLGIASQSGPSAFLIGALRSNPKDALGPQATTWYVDAGTGDDGNSCQASNDACATIGGAVGKAASGDVIEIAAGTYDEHDLEIGLDLTLNGAGKDSTVIDAGAAGRVFKILSTVVISGVRMQNGLTSSGDAFTMGGGGLFNNTSAHLTLRNAALVGNHALGNGGAIFNSGTLVLENTQVLSNTADFSGGGIYNYTLGTITVTQSTLAHNTAVGIFGGGIYAVGKKLVLQDTTVADNNSASFGGGITFNTNNTLMLDRVTLTGNQAASGAALFSQQGTITATNTTVSGNNATSNYGGYYVSGPETSLYLLNNTITYNTRTNTSGNGFNGIMTGNSASASFKNTILAYNQENNCSSFSPPTSLGYNISSDFECGLSQTGDQPGTDPLLGSLEDNGGFVSTHALLPGSPAIDAGDNSPCPAADARGIARPFDGDNDAAAVCDIGAVEARHQISIADSIVTEGDGSPVTAVFTVTLVPSSTTTVEVFYATEDSTAIGGADYTPVSNTLSFNPGETEKFINVSVTGDLDDEVNEVFYVQLSAPVDADLVDDRATGTIIDNDGLPVLTIAGQFILEGNSGSASMEFEVVLSPASASEVTVEYATVDGTATAGSDYTAAGDTVTFQPGETSQTISIDVLGDNIDEGTDEFFTVQLSNPTNAKLPADQAAATITDDDTTRLSHEAGPYVLEGNSGHTPAVFTVTLSTPAAFTITVDYEVSSGFGDDGAKSGEDFMPISGTLTIQPGETAGTYTVQIIGDTLKENDEIYSSLISNANAPITVNGSIAFILNDDFYTYLPLIQK